MLPNGSPVPERSRQSISPTGILNAGDCDAPEAPRDELSREEVLALVKDLLPNAEVRAELEELKRNQHR